MGPDSKALKAMKLIVPSYFYPGPIWDALIKSSSGEVLVVLNVHNGPGRSKDEHYRKLCTRLRKARIGVLGYVSTTWGARDYLDVGNDIALWEGRYGVRDIFFDEAASLPDKLEYFKNLYNRVDGLVVLNHGVIPDEAYLQCGDILVVFESTYAKHALVKFPHWMKRHPKNRFCQLVLACPDEKRMKRAMAKIGETSGFAYITEDIEPNPWDKLPDFWAKELKACK